jgi:hypothetical protein
MRRSLAMILAGITLVATLSSAAEGAARPSAPRSNLAPLAWGAPEKIPGLIHLTTTAIVTSLVCPAAGDCIVGGSYEYTGNPTYYSRSFISIESDGKWGVVEQVPGLLALGSGIKASGVAAIACADVGDCSIFGSDSAGSGDISDFVVDEVHCVWQPAMQVPGLSALETADWAGVAAVSCGAPGVCTAGGSVETAPNTFQAFLVDEVGGVWQDATMVPGLSSLRSAKDPQGASCGPGDSVCSVDCPSAGNCSVLGSFLLTSRQYDSFAINEADGTWHSASITRADPAALSCGAAGSCASVGPPSASGAGNFNDVSVVSQVAGAWKSPVEIPRLAHLNVGKGAQINSIACPAAGDCVAAGSYSRHTVRKSGGLASNPNAFVATQKNGTWGSATPLPNSPQAANGIDLVACASIGNCVATGGPSKWGISVAVERQGVWSAAEALPNTNALRAWSGQDAALVCTHSGYCALTGELSGGAVLLAFVDSWQL